MFKKSGFTLLIKRKRNAVSYARGIFLLAAMIFCTLPAGKMTAHALEEDRAASGTVSVDTELNFCNNPSDLGDLDTNGYHWDQDSKKLSLKNVRIESNVFLPNDTVEIETEGSCFIKNLGCGSNPEKMKLTFSGTGELTIGERLNICGGDGNALTVGEGACVIAERGIAIGASGNVNSVLTVDGTLTAKGESGYIAIAAGKVRVGNKGVLNVSGENGVLLCGMKGDDDLYKNFAEAFTVSGKGCFTAECTEYNVKTESVDLVADGSVEIEANQVFVFPDPESYLPDDCGVMKLRKEGGNYEVNFVKKGTDPVQVYKGIMTIHERHEWLDDWEKDQIHHWHVCGFNGCFKRKDVAPHSYDSETWLCTACGVSLDVALEGAEGLIYNGQEQEPGVTVKVDNTGLDESQYNVVYRNNTDAGEASVTVTGNGDFQFERTVTFQIGKATPTIAWDSSSQNKELVYTGSTAAIPTPTVTLAGGETFGGTIHYSYKAIANDSKAGGSDEYTSGLPKNVGTYSIRASIEATGSYIAAVSTDLRIQITRAVPTIQWKYGSQGAKVSYTGSPAKIDAPTVTLKGEEKFQGKITYSYKMGGAESSGNYLPDPPINAGTYTVKASIEVQNDNYTDVESTVALTVEKAENAPKMPSAEMNVPRECTKVSDVELPENWKWQEADRDADLEMGKSKTAAAVYDGADKGNYKNETVVVTITRANCSHTNTELRNVTAATCQKPGYRGDTYCLDCGALLIRGTETAKAEHSGGTANCLSGKICTACGTEYTAKDSGVHIHTELRGIKEATCVEAGYTGDTYCKSCNTLISSGTVIPTVDHVREIRGFKEATCVEAGYTGDTYCKSCNTLISSGTVIPAADHVKEIRGFKAATCVEAGYTGDTYCKSCNTLISSGTVIPATGHKEEVTSEEGATATSEGKRIYTCVKCGATRQEIIPKLQEEEQGSEDDDMDEPVKTDTEIKSPPTGQSGLPWRNLPACALEIIMAIGVFYRAKRTD